MVILKMKRAKVKGGQAEFSRFLEKVAGDLRPLVHPTIAAQAEILGLSLDALRTPPTERNIALGSASRQEDGEVFADGQSIFVVSLSRPDRRSVRTVRHPDESVNACTPISGATLIFAYLGPRLESRRWKNSKHSLRRLLV